MTSTSSSRRPDDRDAARLLVTLAETGDLGTAAERCGLSVQDARDRLRALATRLAPAAAEAPARPAPAASPARRAGGEGTPSLRLFCDGAARGNPGPAGAGAVLQSPDGEIVARLGRYLGETTNNVAEYEALLLGLRHAEALGAREVQVVSDSELMVKQLQGRYKVKAPHLKGLYDEARARLQRFDRWAVSHVLRAQNTAADQMANRAVDEQLDD